MERLAEMAGLSDSQIYRIAGGTSQAKLENMAALAKSVGVSLDWLAFGEHSVTERPAAYGESEFLFVPRLDVTASAGHGALVEGERERERLAFLRDWLQKECISTKHLAVIEARGDSMEPMIHSGDLLLIDLAQRNPAIPGVFVLRVDDTLLVKRLQLDLRGQVVARSDNEAYSELVVSLEEIDVVGRAVWAGRRL